MLWCDGLLLESSERLLLERVFKWLLLDVCRGREMLEALLCE